jgi:hypothetical protein
MELSVFAPEPFASSLENLEIPDRPIKKMQDKYTYSALQKVHSVEAKGDTIITQLGNTAE